LLSKMDHRQAEAARVFVAQRDSAGFAATGNELGAYLSGLKPEAYATTVDALPLPDSAKFESGWSLFKHKIPMWLFALTCLGLVVLSFRFNLSLIPVLGLILCFYMMAQIPADSWLGFLIWLLIGLVIYFGYGFKNSRLRSKRAS